MQTQPRVTSWLTTRHALLTQIRQTGRTGEEECGVSFGVQMSYLGQSGFFPLPRLGVIVPICSPDSIKRAQRSVPAPDLTQTDHNQHHNMKLVRWGTSNDTVHLSGVLSTYDKNFICEITTDAITINTTHTDPSVFPLRLPSPFPNPLTNPGLTGVWGGGRPCRLVHCTGRLTLTARAMHPTTSISHKTTVVRGPPIIHPTYHSRARA